MAERQIRCGVRQDPSRSPQLGAARELRRMRCDTVRALCSASGAQKAGLGAPHDIIVHRVFKFKPQEINCSALPLWGTRREEIAISTLMRAELALRSCMCREATYGRSQLRERAVRIL